LSLNGQNITVVEIGLIIPIPQGTNISIRLEGNKLGHRTRWIIIPKLYIQEKSANAFSVRKSAKWAEWLLCYFTDGWVGTKK
jgi:hypothetical protein